LISLDAGQLAALNTRVRGMTLLIDLEFLSGTQYVTTYAVDIIANGHTYVALGNVLSVSAFRESESLAMDKLTLKLSLVNNAMLAYVIGAATEYRNRAVRIYVQLINETWTPVQLPKLRWFGVMDKVSISRSPNKEGLGSGSISLVCQRAGLSRFRTSMGLRLTDYQQQLEYPGDRGLEYTQSLIEDPTVWVTAKFQEQ
jgi:hypothetical protein